MDWNQRVPDVNMGLEFRDVINKHPRNDQKDFGPKSETYVVLQPRQGFVLKPA